VSGDIKAIERYPGTLLLRGPGLRPYALPMGCVVAVVDLMYCRPTTSTEHAPDDRERALGDHGPGRFAWSLTSISPIRQPTSAYAATGQLGLWTWSPPEGMADLMEYPSVLQEATS
jgi:hypothetical protein